MLKIPPLKTCVYLPKQKPKISLYQLHISQIFSTSDIYALIAEINGDNIELRGTALDAWLILRLCGLSYFQKI